MLIGTYNNDASFLVLKISSRLSRPVIRPVFGCSFEEAEPDDSFQFLLGVEMSWAIDARELPLWVERCRDDWELSGDPDPSTSFLLLLGGERSNSGFGEGE